PAGEGAAEVGQTFPVAVKVLDRVGQLGFGPAAVEDRHRVPELDKAPHGRRADESRSTDHQDTHSVSSISPLPYPSLPLAREGRRYRGRLAPPSRVYANGIGSQGGFDANSVYLPRASLPEGRRGGVEMADLQATMGRVIRRERRRQGATLKALAERAALSVV